MDYQFMMGKCNVSKIKRDFILMESKRLARYLEKTKNNYKHRIAYCIGDFRTAMEKAVEMTSISVTIVPKIETIERNIQPGKSFVFGSLNQKDYLQDLAEAISKPLGRKVIEVKGKEEIINDNDWYVL
jgi:predicted RNA-binding protein